MLDRSRQEEIKIKFLGTKINVREEIKTRRLRAKQAMRLMTNIWNKNKIVREELRVRLYRACVETHLMYNASTITATGTEIEELNIEQQKGMQIALGIYYPATIGNIALYERTGTEPISMRTIRMRWELFGKVLRGQEEDPALPESHEGLL